MTAYAPLWHLLIEKNMTKTELRQRIGISPNTITKLPKDEDVSMTVINRICIALGVSFEDLMKYIPIDNEEVV